MSLNKRLFTAGPTGAILTDSRFNVVLYTGNRSATVNVGTTFKPDFGIIFPRSYADHRTIFSTSFDGDIIGLQQHSAKESFSALDIVSDGFQVGNSGQVNTTNGTLVAYVWGANGGSVSNNTNGDITSSVQVGPGGSFSIATYTGNGSSNQTVGHGLSDTCKMLLVKRLNSGDAWRVQHSGLANDRELDISGINAHFDDGAFGNLPDASVFNLESSASAVNANNSTYVAFCFADVIGYRKFGTYVANQNANGPVVSTGFQPDFLLVKNINKGDQEWVVLDSKRDTSNPRTANSILAGQNGTNAEGQGNDVDFNSDGFQLKSNGGGLNYQNGDTLIYWAEKIKTS